MTSSGYFNTEKIVYKQSSVRAASLIISVIISNSDKGDVKATEIGNVVLENDKFQLQYLPDESQATVWPSMNLSVPVAINPFLMLHCTDELIPYDGVPRVVIDKVPLPLVIISILLAAAGVLFTVGCFIFDIFFRSKR